MIDEFAGPLCSGIERERFIESLWELHEEISTEATKPSIDAATLMRLMALGINHCLVGVGTILMEKERTQVADDPRQLNLPFEDVPGLMDHAHREKD